MADAGKDTGDEGEKKPLDQDAKTDEQILEDENDEPLNLATVSEELGLELKELYGVEVDMGLNDPDDDASGRKTMSIGELKDAARRAEPLERRFEEFDNERAGFELDRSATQRNLMNLAGELQRLSGQSINPSVLAALDEQEAVRAEGEQVKLLNVQKSWRDPKVRAEETSVIGDFFRRRYGVTTEELKGIKSAVWIKAMRDFAISATKAETAALLGRKPERKATKLANRTKRSALGKGPARIGSTVSRDDRVGAVSNLIGGKRRQ